MVTTDELKAELAATHAAINEILETAEEVSADGRSLRMAKLADLRAHVDWLEGKIAARLAAEAGRGRNRIIQVNPIL